MRTVWGLEIYRDFMKCAWEVGQFTPEQVNRILLRLHELGYEDTTKEGLRQHAQKMIRADKGGARPRSTDTSRATTTASPTKARPGSKRGRPTKKPRTKPGAKRNDWLSDESEDDDECDSPKKRVKKDNSSSNDETGSCWDECEFEI